MGAAAVLALCLPPQPGAAPSLEDPVDLEALLARAAALGAFPAVYQNLRVLRPNLTLPAAWEGRFRRNFVHNLALRQEESRWAAHLVEAGLACRPVKGVRLVELLYPDLSWRRVADIDLLMPVSQVEAAYYAL